MAKKLDSSLVDAKLQFSDVIKNSDIFQSAESLLKEMNQQNNEPPLNKILKKSQRPIKKSDSIVFGTAKQPEPIDLKHSKEIDNFLNQFLKHHAAF